MFSTYHVVNENMGTPFTMSLSEVNSVSDYEGLATGSGVESQRDVSGDEPEQSFTSPTNNEDKNKSADEDEPVLAPSQGPDVVQEHENGGVVAPVVSKKQPETCLQKIFYTKGDFPGQRGMNPCCCFSWCCFETCSLRTGCIVLGSLLFFLGLSGVLRIFGEVKFGLSDFPARSDEDITNGSLVDMDPYELQSVGQIIDFIFANPAVASLDASGVAVFHFLAGLLLLMGSCYLYSFCCLTTSVIILVGAVYDLVFWCMTTVIVFEVDIPDLKSKARTTSIIIYWLLFIVQELFNLYAFLCSFGLYIQIRKGEYERGTVVAVLKPKVSKELSQDDESRPGSA